MKIVLADVASADGFITKGDAPNVSHWSSKEDWEHFLALRQQYELVVMGRKTFEAVQPKPEVGRLRVVLTSHPDDYAVVAVTGQLEFSALTPEELVASLKARGYNSMLLVGGGAINGAFLAAGLADELYLTIEPTLFGNGTPLLGNAAVDVALRLLESRQLNDQGTLLMHYAFVYPNA